MKNVTLSIDDRLLDRARRLAAGRGTSVNRMIREFLAREVATEEDAAARARRRMGELSRLARPPTTDWEWNREEAYADRLPRHERPDLRGDRDG